MTEAENKERVLQLYLQTYKTKFDKTNENIVNLEVQLLLMREENTSLKEQINTLESQLAAANQKLTKQKKE